VKFQRGDLVEVRRRTGWERLIRGPAIVIEVRARWIKVWIPAQNKAMIIAGFLLKHHNEPREIK